jgi:hypothetical protein
MGMGIDKARKNHPPGAVDFGEASRVFLDPGILEGIGCFPDRDDFPRKAKNRRIGHDIEFAQCAATARADSRRRPEGEELADVEEKQSLRFAVLF